MSEQALLCPFFAGPLNTHCGLPLEERAYKYAYCLQEKCAMWRAGIDPATARNIRAQIGQIDYDIDCVGYCGLAGKP